MASKMSYVTFHNGIRFPTLGFGTYMAKGAQCYELVKKAIQVGYRYIDTAAFYENEADVGAAVRDAVKEFDVKRSELFVVTKVPIMCNRPALVVPSLKRSLKLLGLDYADMYLVHTPLGKAPVDDDPSLEFWLDIATPPARFDETSPAQVWKAMEACVDGGLARCVGVSNFNSEQIRAVVESCRIKPVTNQVECHPLLQQRRLRRFPFGVFISTWNCGSTYCHIASVQREQRSVTAINLHPAKRDRCRAEATSQVAAAGSKI